MPKNRRDRRSGSRKSIQHHRILRSLATWGEVGGITKLVGELLDSSGCTEGNTKEGDTMKGSSNIRQCLRKVSDGHFTADVKVLCSSGVAPYN